MAGDTQPDSAQEPTGDKVVRAFSRNENRVVAALLPALAEAYVAVRDSGRNSDATRGKLAALHDLLEGFLTEQDVLVIDLVSGELHVEGVPWPLLFRGTGVMRQEINQFLTDPDVLTLDIAGGRVDIDGKPRRFFLTALSAEAIAREQPLEGRVPLTAEITQCLSRLYANHVAFRAGVTPKELGLFIDALTRDQKLVAASGGLDYVLQRAGVEHIQVQMIRFARTADEDQAGVRPVQDSFGHRLDVLADEYVSELLRAEAMDENERDALMAFVKRAIEDNTVAFLAGIGKAPGQSWPDVMDRMRQDPRTAVALVTQGAAVYRQKRQGRVSVPDAILESATNLGRELVQMAASGDYNDQVGFPDILESLRTELIESENGLAELRDAPEKRAAIDGQLRDMSDQVKANVIASQAAKAAEQDPEAMELARFALDVLKDDAERERVSPLVQGVLSELGLAEEVAEGLSSAMDQLLVEDRVLDYLDGEVDDIDTWRDEAYGGIMAHPEMAASAVLKRAEKRQVESDVAITESLIDDLERLGEELVDGAAAGRWSADMSCADIMEEVQVNLASRAGIGEDPAFQERARDVNDRVKAGIIATRQRVDDLSPEEVARLSVEMFEDQDERRRVLALMEDTFAPGPDGKGQRYIETLVAGAADRQALEALLGGEETFITDEAARGAASLLDDPQELAELACTVIVRKSAPQPGRSRALDEAVAPGDIARQVVEGLTAALLSADLPNPEVLTDLLATLRREVPDALRGLGETAISPADVATLARAFDQTEVDFEARRFEAEARRLGARANDLLARRVPALAVRDKIIERVAVRAEGTGADDEERARLVDGPREALSYERCVADFLAGRSDAAPDGAANALTLCRQAQRIASGAVNAADGAQLRSDSGLAAFATGMIERLADLVNDSLRAGPDQATAGVAPMVKEIAAAVRGELEKRVGVERVSAVGAAMDSTAADAAAQVAAEVIALRFDACRDAMTTDPKARAGFGEFGADVLARTPSRDRVLRRLAEIGGERGMPRDVMQDLIAQSEGVFRNNNVLFSFFGKALDDFGEREPEVVREVLSKPGCIVHALTDMARQVAAVKKDVRPLPSVLIELLPEAIRRLGDRMARAAGTEGFSRDVLMPTAMEAVRDQFESSLGNTATDVEGWQRAEEAVAVWSGRIRAAMVVAEVTADSLDTEALRARCAELAGEGAVAHHFVEELGDTLLECGVDPDIASALTADVRGRQSRYRVVRFLAGEGAPEIEAIRSVLSDREALVTILRDAVREEMRSGAADRGADESLRAVVGRLCDAAVQCCGDEVETGTGLPARLVVAAAEVFARLDAGSATVGTPDWLCDIGRGLALDLIHGLVPVVPAERADAATVLDASDECVERIGAIVEDLPGHRSLIAGLPRSLKAMGVARRDVRALSKGLCRDAAARDFADWLSDGNAPMPRRLRAWLTGSPGEGVRLLNALDGPPKARLGRLCARLGDTMPCIAAGQIAGIAALPVALTERLAEADDASREEAARLGDELLAAGILARVLAKPDDAAYAANVLARVVGDDDALARVRVVLEQQADWRRCQSTWGRAHFADVFQAARSARRRLDARRDERAALCVDIARQLERLGGSAGERGRVARALADRMPMSSDNDGRRE